MSGDSELLLLAATGLCTRCSHPGVKRVEKVYQQRSPQENGESFEVAQNYSYPGSSRNQISSKGIQQEPDAIYIDLMAVDHYNWGCLQKSWEDGSGDGGSSDGHSYENVLVCRPGPPAAEGLRGGTQAGHPAAAEESDYQNCAAMHHWRESARAGGHAGSARPGTPAGSPGDQEEPDYVNA